VGACRRLQHLQLARRHLVDRADALERRAAADSQLADEAGPHAGPADAHGEIAQEFLGDRLDRPGRQIGRMGAGDVVAGPEDHVDAALLGDAGEPGRVGRQPADRAVDDGPAAGRPVGGQLARRHRRVGLHEVLPLLERSLPRPPQGVERQRRLGGGPLDRVRAGRVHGVRHVPQHVLVGQGGAERRCRHRAEDGRHHARRPHKGSTLDLHIDPALTPTLSFPAGGEGADQNIVR